MNLQCYLHGQIQTQIIKLNSPNILNTNFYLVMMYIPQEAHLDELHYSEEFQLTVKALEHRHGSMESGYSPADR